MTPDTRQTAQDAPGPTYIAPLCLRVDLATWRAHGRIGAYRTGSDEASGTLWLEFGPILAYPYNTGPGQPHDWRDPNERRRLYYATAELVRFRMVEAGLRIRSGTHFRLGATMLDETLIATRICPACHGRDQACERCMGTRMEPASVGWRSDYSGMKHRDFAEKLALFYQRTYAELHDIEHGTVRDTPAGSCAY